MNGFSLHIEPPSYYNILAIVDRMTDVEVKDASGCQIHSLIDVDGYRMWRPTFRTAEEQAEHVRNVVNVPLRDDDIMFCSAPKSGIGLALGCMYCPASQE